MFILFNQVVNTTSDQLSDVAVEASVWDLDGECPYYGVTDKLSLPPKKVIPVSKMRYYESKAAKPVYFVLLKLYKTSNYEIISRNFYWLHLPGGDYKLLESHGGQKVPLKITSQVAIIGSSYEIQMHVTNMSKKPQINGLSLKNPVKETCSGGLEETVPCRKEDMNLLRRISHGFSGGGNDNFNVVQTGGADAGVAFFLHFSVHAAKNKELGEDTRILPVHYTDNYFSLVPGEAMTVSISFKAPSGVTPTVRLHGWNYHSTHTVL